MDISNLILTDAGLQAFDNGAWVGNIPEGGDVRLKVLAIGCATVQAALNAKHEALRAANQGKELTSEQLTQALNEVLGETVLQDWEGFTAGGEPIPFDRAKALQWVTTRNGAKFSNLVFRASKMLSDDANAFAETAEKNSSHA